MNRGRATSPAAREQFATVIALDSASTWKRPAPKASAHPGRVHVDGDARPAQALLLTDAETAEWIARRSGSGTGVSSMAAR
ncbi:hypothetical protein [Streptomyces sp. LaBMicrA B280]|uniref:hypothetical protein n=1 Tax=Streptomyces sp. LaBMicrA B280 TaxID=3391001 RepID=UPI003BA544D4